MTRRVDRSAPLRLRSLASATTAFHRRRRTALAGALAAVLALILPACTDMGMEAAVEDDSTSEPDPDPVVSFAASIEPLLAASCAFSGCHGTQDTEAGLVLTAGQSYGNLVGVPALFYAPALRVVSGDPDESVLMDKISGGGRFGGLMPPSGSLSDSDIALVRAWIVEGALDN